MRFDLINAEAGLIKVAKRGEGKGFFEIRSKIRVTRVSVQALRSVLK
jgi:hypothetical protein